MAEEPSARGATDEQRREGLARTVEAIENLGYEHYWTADHRYKDKSRRLITAYLHPETTDERLVVEYLDRMDYLIGFEVFRPVTLSISIDETIKAL